jgi:3-methylcrotonyl-CoA carboxylase beta subunit
VKAAQLRKEGKDVTPEMMEEIKAPILAQYEHESSCYYSTAHLWDDGVMEMTDTRDFLGLGIAMSLNAPIPDFKVGIFRM